MPPVELFLAIGVFLATAGVISTLPILQARRRTLRSKEQRVVAFTSELGHARQARERLSELQRSMADSLDSSSSKIRDTHRAISDIPFDILEQIPLTRDGARQARRIHDLASDGVYAGISMLARWQKRRIDRD